MSARRQRQTNDDQRPPEPLSPFELALVQALARVIVERHVAPQLEPER